MIGVNDRRMVIEKIVKKTRNDAKKKNKKILTIDPIIKNAKKIFPYFSDKEIQDYSINALRVILGEEIKSNNQSTLLTHLLGC